MTDAPIFRSLSLQQTATTYASLVNELRDGELDLDAPYQRGHVWGTDRQVALIRSLTMGLPTAAIYVNERDIMQPRVIIDGKQRITAAARWLDGELEVPAAWFPAFAPPRPGEAPDHDPTQILADPDAPNITFAGLTPAGQRLWKNSATVAIYWSKFTGPDAIAQENLLFDLLNFGGVAQGDSDLT